MSGQSQNSRLTGQKTGETLTEWLCVRLACPVDQASRARAALHVLDWAGCAIAGARSDAARAMRSVTKSAESGAVAANAHAHCLYLGSLGNVLEMDDVDKRALLHPGPVIVPAAIVATRMVHPTAAEFLDALVRGYEAMIRIGRAVGPAHYRYWHNTGTCGPFGAAAAAGSLLGLDTDQMTNALGLAGTQASGLWQTRHEPASQAKQLHTARAAHAGLLAAELAHAGFIGPRTILEGPQGFFAAMCGDANPQNITDFDPAGASWAINEVSFKPWPACRHVHAAIDAALALRAGGIEPGSVKSITVRTYKDALVFCDRKTPGDVIGAKFSLQHSVAVALLRGAPTLGDFEGNNLTAPDIAGLREMTIVEEDRRFTERYPARFGSAVDIALRDGSHRSSTIDDALGDPENPVTDEKIIKKAKTLMAAHGVTPAIGDALCTSILDLGSARGDINRVVNLLFEGLAS